jgi:hypothetical protein
LIVDLDGRSADQAIHLLNFRDDEKERSIKVRDCNGDIYKTVWISKRWVAGVLEVKVSRNWHDFITNEKIISRKNIFISRLNFSVVSGFGACRTEFLNLTLNKLRLEQIQSKNGETVKISLKYMNIDNNSRIVTIYPVIMTPYKSLAYIEAEADRNMLELHLERSYHTNLTLISAIRVKLMDVVLRIEEGFINTI